MGKVVSVIGIDISKRFFQLHGAATDGEPVPFLPNHPLERLPHRPAGRTLGSRDILSFYTPFDPSSQEADIRISM